VLTTTHLPHFLAFSSALIPATRAPVEPAAVRAKWASSGTLSPETLTIDLLVAPVFAVRDGIRTLLNGESIARFDAHWRGHPPIITQNPGAAINSYCIDTGDITANEELLLLSYFTTIEHRILAFMKADWEAIVDEFTADPDMQRLYTTHLFHRPAPTLSYAQMSQLMNNRISPDSIRKYLKARATDAPAGRVTHVVSAEAANDAHYESDEASDDEPPGGSRTPATSSKPDFHDAAPESAADPGPVNGETAPPEPHLRDSETTGWRLNPLALIKRRGRDD
jgi:hypothetical protein